MKKSIFLIIAIAFSYALSAQYGENIRSDRPGQSLSPFTLGSKTIQIQSGYNYGENENNIIQSSFANYNNVIRLGILENLDVNATLNYSKSESSIGDQTFDLKGFDNIAIGARYSILEGEGYIPTLGFESRFSLPIESQDYNNEELGITNILITQHAISEKFAVTSNWIWINRDSENTFNYTLNSAYTLDDNWSVFFEFFGNLNDEFSTNYDFGFAYLTGSNFQLDIGFGRLTTEDNPQMFVDAGLSWRIDWR